MGAMHDDLFALAARQHGVLSRAPALAQGTSRSTLRQAVAAGRFDRLGTHVLRAAGAPPTWRQQVMAAVLDGPTTAVASHLTAAALWRLPGFGKRRPHVTVSHRVSHGRTSLAVVHLTRDLPDHHIEVVDGIPLTTPTRTLFDLASCIGARRLARAVDTAVAMHLTSYTRLCAIRDRLCVQGRDGSTLFREVLADRDEAQAPPESELEARFLDLVRRYRLPEPQRQAVLGDDREVAGRVDFWFPDANLVVELDGRRYHSSLLDREEDARRDLVHLRAGRHVLRLTWHQVTAEEKRVADALAQRLEAA